MRLDALHGAVLVEEAVARAQREGAHEGGHARERVDGAATGEVDDARAVEEAIGAPDPMTADGIYLRERASERGVRYGSRRSRRTKPVRTKE